MTRDCSTDLTPAQLMLLSQWLSPAFPVGAFSYSHGLEQALYTSPDLDVEAWLTNILGHGAGRSDAILMGAAYDGLKEEADALARALAPSKERLHEIVLQGRSFCKTLRTAFGIEIVELTYPVAIGTAARERALPRQAVIVMYLHAFIANLVASAQRLSPLGQTEAQAMIKRLSEICAEVAMDTRTATLDDIGGSCWAADIVSMQHETMQTRIFQT